MIIDFHTHAFPDYVAAKAIPTLEGAGKIKAYTSGTIESLLDSMDNAEIDRSVICSIATHPSQFESILEWSSSVSSRRIIPLPSIHPAEKQYVDRVDQVVERGFIGIKMHPYYQDFSLDDKRLFPLYEALSDNGLMLVVHCGYDIAFPRTRVADPDKILSVSSTFPELKLIATHFGGWKIWDEVETKLIGREIYLEISFALSFLPKEQVKRMLRAHSAHHILFGSDSPWDDQAECVRRVKELQLSSRLEEALFYKNAQQLIGFS